MAQLQFACVLALVVVALIAAGHPATATPVLVVPTQSGNVQGFVQNDLARAFLGIPFADPPQRFGVAAPATPWNGVRNATAFPKPCIQSATLGVEDCLYLNVFTPKNATAGDKLPVMVWIHGGRYWTGQTDQYQGQWLSGNGNVVLVTIQVPSSLFASFQIFYLSVVFVLLCRFRSSFFFRRFVLPDDCFS
jgi:para-nitrobenzyl esterase